MDGMTREKFGKLSPGQKLRWILTYYGVTILCVCVGFAVLCSLIFAVFGKRSEPDLRIIVLDDHASHDNALLIQEELGSLLEKEVEVTAYLKSDPVGMQAFAVRLASDRIDFVTASREEMDRMRESGYVTGCVQLPAAGNYARATVSEEGADRLSEELYIASTTNPLQEEESIREKVLDYFLN